MSNNLNAVGNIPENAVRGLDGKPIILDMVEHAPNVCKWTLEHLGIVINSKHVERIGVNDDGYLFPSGDHKRPLTMAERGAIEAFVWHIKTFRQPLRRDIPVIFPRIIHSIADESVSEDDHFTFSDEARACMFAGVIEKVFCIDAEVIETPHGWIVSVSDRERIEKFGMREVHQMQGACMVLCNYTVAPASDADIESPGGLDKRYSPEARRTWHERTNAQASRIESKLDALLSRLDAHIDPHRATKDAKDAPAAVDVFAEEGKDPHTLPGKTAAKSKSRK